MPLQDALIKPKIFIGLDIHKKSWSVSIQTDLFFHKTYSMPSVAEDLFQYVEQTFPNHDVDLVYEAGCCGFSAARYFLNLGWHVLVVNPSDIKTGDKERYQKTDALDSRNLSNQLKAGVLRGVYIPTEEHEQFTTLARHRTQVTKKLRQSKLHIKSMLLFHGIAIPTEFDNSNWTKDFMVFNRPQWNKLLLNLKKQKNTTDLVLFTKWDRFSRNAGDAYQMISLLRKLGVEPQAIEQPLDLAIPENKMMLAFYLAAPEVENDRRALNTFHGMRRAKKEGRYMGIAPFGYANKSKEDGSKYIALVEPAASVMRWIFEELAKGIFNTEQIYHMACRRGFKRTKNNMWGLIRNPVYCGKIFIPKYKDEESRFVTGQHEPLISEGLFYNVQDILDGKSRLYRPKIKTVVDFPLRGFFICPKCQKKLQGSKCKGRHKYYHYYHCEAQCKFRINSEIANELFIEDLNKYQPIAEVKKLYSSILYETHRDLANNAGEQKRRLVEQIKDFELRLSNARDLLLTSKIEADDYKLMKDDYGARIANLERELSTVTKDKHSIEELLIKGVDNLIKLSDSYLKRDLSDARSLIGLVYPENFTIHENKVQTTRVNKIVESIYLINKLLKAKKNGTKDDFYLLSREVTSTGQISINFMEDLKRLAYYI